LNAALAQQVASIRTCFGRIFVSWSGMDLASVSLSDFSPAPSSPGFESGDVPPEGYKVVKDLILYFRGEPVSFRLPRLCGLSDFQRKVLEMVWHIPFGATFTYGQVAEFIGVPQGARAVGTAVGKNPFPIIIPCHRVVASGGKLGGYGAGTAWKRALLEMEGELLGEAVSWRS